MPTAQSDWRASTIGVVATVSVADWLAALNDLLVAEAAANPTTAIWGVSDYNAGNGTLEIKKRLVTDNVRMLFFGGQVPNAAALFNSQVAQNYILYGLVAPTAGTTGPDASYTSGSPYSTPSTLGKGFARTTATYGQSAGNRVRYFENDDQFVFVIHNETSSTHTGVFVGGNLLDDPDGNPVHMMLTTGAGSSTTVNVLSTQALTDAISVTNSTQTGRFWSAEAKADSTSGIPAATAVRDGAPRRCLGIGTFCVTAGAFVSMLKNEASTKSYMIPVPFVSESPAEFLGHLRQIRVGPRAALGTVLQDGPNELAFAVSANPSGVADALWLVNP